jgi:HK97 family phage prohead protease
MKIERRYTTGANRVGIEKRADGKPKIVGYASVFHRADDPGTEYWLWPGEIVERIMPTAFDRAAKEDDVRGLFNHDPNIVLGRNKAGTLRLSVDAVGLRYEIDPPDWAGPQVESIGRKDVTGSSFGFSPQDTTFREEVRGDKTVTIIERNAVQLWDVSPVTYPAYESASVGLRSAAFDPEAVRREVEAWRAGRPRGVRRDVVMAAARCVELDLRASSCGVHGFRKR